MVQMRVTIVFPNRADVSMDVKTYYLHVTNPYMAPMLSAALDMWDDYLADQKEGRSLNQ